MITNSYIKINNPTIYYHNLDLIGRLFREHGGNPIYYISEYRDKIRHISNQNIKIEERIFIYANNIIEFLKILDKFIIENI
jgi:hypothetical protein